MRKIIESSMGCGYRRWNDIKGDVECKYVIHSLRCTTCPSTDFPSNCPLTDAPKIKTPRSLPRRRYNCAKYKKNGACMNTLVITLKCKGVTCGHYIPNWYKQYALKP
jgi:hypothetical protein